jgi:hypothetical protein
MVFTVPNFTKFPVAQQNFVDIFCTEFYGYRTKNIDDGDKTDWRCLVQYGCHCSAHSVQIVLTHFHRNWLRNLESVGKISCTLLRKVWLSQPIFMKRMVARQLVLGNPVANFMKFLQTGSWVTDWREEGGVCTQNVLNFILCQERLQVSDTPGHQTPAVMLVSAT